MPANNQSHYIKIGIRYIGPFASRSQADEYAITENLRFYEILSVEPPKGK